MSGFFVFDVETLGLESTAVCLSLGMVYCDPDESYDNDTFYKMLIQNGCFVKFDSMEQIKIGNRTITKTSMDWWNRQGDIQKRTSLIPNKEVDLDAVSGLTALRKWWAKHPNAKNLPIWVRGTLDQPIMESLMRAFDFEPFVSYNVYRDVRTAIDLIYTDTANAGYVDIPDFDQYQVIKHDPLHDSAYDAMMLIRGKQ